jgi:bloom syndrome protein
LPSQVVDPIEDIPVQLNQHEIELKEYVELCKSIIEGRPLESVLPAPKSKAKKSKSKPSLGEPTTSQDEIPIKTKETRKRSKQEVPLSSAGSDDTPTLHIDPTPQKRRRSSRKPIESEKSEIESEEVAPPSLPFDPPLPVSEPAHLSLPRWHSEREINLAPIRGRLASIIADYDHKLTSSARFDKFAPLDALSLRFWQTSFEWDPMVRKASKEYVERALIAKQRLDPSFEGKSDNTASFGFKPLQREAINMALAQKDVLLALSTGGGKTMCYVLPAMLEKGLTVVVSPLIALIQDQVTLLDSMGIGAAGLSCQMSAEELEATYDRLLGDPTFKLIYVTPERIGRNERFVKILAELHRRGFLQRVVVDEAHCISEWGHDFRKDYRRLSVLKETMPTLPIMAVTGTCTPSVRKDIVEQLGMVGSSSLPSQHYVLQTSFNRPNLWFQVASKSDEAPMADMLFYILNQQLSQKCGIVYALTTKDAERLAEFFAEHGLSTTYYHGAMTPAARQENHAKWSTGAAKLMCTTVAFGLGIDKSNVRYVIHSTMPTSLEAYYQQAGRAGRDGNSADCILFFHPKDRTRIEHVIKLNAHMMRRRQRLSELQRIAKEALAEKIPLKGSPHVSSAHARVGGSRRKSQQVGNSQNAKFLEQTAQSSPSEFVDQSALDSVSIVDIVDIPEDGSFSFARMRREDGQEIYLEEDHFNFDLEESSENAFIRQMKTEKLDDVTSFCREKRTCRRVHLMRFFGQKFVSRECEHSCDICNPTTRRATDKLTKAGQSEWADLKEQREQRRRESEKPISEAMKKIQAIVLDQEETEARETMSIARKLDEEAYERQFEHGSRNASGSKRPAKPTRFGASSPLARKLRQSNSSTLGDPSDYEHLHEQLQSASTKSKLTAAKIVSVSPTPISSPIAQLQQQLQSRPIVSSGPLEKIDTESDSLVNSESPGLLDDLMASIAKVAAEKERRRQLRKVKSLQKQPLKTSPREAEAQEALDSSTSRSPAPNLPLPTISNHSQLAHTAPRPSDAIIRTGEDSKLLFEVKQAFQQIADDHNTNPKLLLSQKLLRVVVSAKPTSVLDLAAIKGIGPKRAQIFAPYLLHIFKSDH